VRGVLGMPKPPKLIIIHSSTAAFDYLSVDIEGLLLVCSLLFAHESNVVVCAHFQHRKVFLMHYLLMEQVALHFMGMMEFLLL
jgi:hypothetical protein